ncbi:IclR family transcriptional regulator [Streptomyces xiangluensis]|uniref:IclR family transcriptional regulator n=1 Tax=Streptomyces xiangluensis TaxID=2665720 RepID=A0ABV8YL89_9ACTN
MKNEPPYPIASVDHALHLATLLQQEGPMRVSDAAERLGVSPSTAHRLLAMLVYRDFAEQRPDRRYQAGEVLRPTVTTQAPVTLLREVALPHMQELADAKEESVNLIVLAGTEARFLATAESQSPQILRVGTRAGRSLPAHLTSGGKAILAALPTEDLTAFCDGDTEVDLPRLRRELARVRKRGFALNNQETETGLTAIGVRVRAPAHGLIAAVAIAIPTARFRRDRLPHWVSALATTASAIERELEARA